MMFHNLFNQSPVDGLQLEMLCIKDVHCSVIYSNKRQSCTMEYYGNCEVELLG